MRYAFEHLILWLLLAFASGYATGWVRRRRRLSPRAREARELARSVEKLLR